MVQIDPDGWLIKVLDFEKPDAENQFQLEHASGVLGRLEAARALAEAAKTKPAIARALSRAWKREKAVVGPAGAGRAAVQRPGAFRTALLEAARDPEARVSVAAIGGLAKLGRDDTTESILRAAWSNPKEAYGARRAALRGLIAWKVEDAPALLEAALKLPADHHRIAAMALEILLETPGSKARELAALYSRHGQPSALRSPAVRSLTRLAKDDPALQEIVVSLVDDKDSSLRFGALEAVRELKLTRAFPMLKARLERESNGFSAFMRRQLQEAIEALAGLDGTTKAAVAKPAGPGVAELEAQAVELEQKARDLRNRISSLKSGEPPGGRPPPRPPVGRGPSRSLTRRPGGFRDAGPDSDGEGDGPRVHGLGPVDGNHHMVGTPTGERSDLGRGGLGPGHRRRVLPRLLAARLSGRTGRRPRTWTVSSRSWSRPRWSSS